MRWYWIDRFVEFEPGKHARSVKNISLSEEHLHDHFPGYPVMPASLIIEGMAQTAGILVGQVSNFSENVILAKVRRANFHGLARPGDQLFFDACLERFDADGAGTSGEVSCNGRTLAEIDIIFSHVGRGQSELDLPEHNFVFGEQFKLLIDNSHLESLAGEPGQEQS